MLNTQDTHVRSHLTQTGGAVDQYIDFESAKFENQHCVPLNSFFSLDSWLKWIYSSRIMKYIPQKYTLFSKENFYWGQEEV